MAEKTEYRYAPEVETSFGREHSLLVRFKNAEGETERHLGESSENLKIK